MKKLIYIISGLLFLAVTSCNKEVFKPRSCGDEQTEVMWKSAEVKGEEGSNGGKQSSVNDKANTGDSGASTGTSTSDENNSDSGITDPNNDPDSAKRKGKK